MLPLEGFREKLLAVRQELFRQAAETEDELLWLETDIESEAEERGQGENLVRLLDRMDERLKTEIESVDRALVKLEAGRYGACEICGKEIPLLRLEAVPATAMCVLCAEASEARAAPRK